MGDSGNADPTYTTNAVDCTTGILIANGVKLHSHIGFHLNCHRNLDFGANEISHLEKEFHEQLEGFFGHLDQLIRAGYFNGERINIDLVLAGGLIDAYDKGTNEFTRKMIENSPILQEAVIKMIQDRLAQTEKLAGQHEIKIDFSRSIF